MLDPTNGDILVIDAGAGREFAADKFDEKGNLIASGYQVSENRSTTDMIADLEYAGYSATLVDMTFDPDEWVLYDLLIVAGGASTTPISDAAFQSALTSFAVAGGHYIVEGGEVGYVHNGAGFGADVLHIQSWNGDSSGSVTVADAAHYVMSVPNVITGPITVSYSGYGDQDSASPTADAVMVGGWTEGSSASVITYDSNPAPAGGQYVGFMFNYSAMDVAARGQLLQNAVNWLLALEVGNCSVSGTVTLQGETNHAGIAVEALPGGGSTVTAADGSYSFPGLYAGSYNIRASKQLWSVGSVDVTLEDGQNLTGVDMVLTPVQEMADCSQPALAIPDNNPAGISDIMTLALPQATVANVEVYVDITHTWQGDLLLNLTSPEGTTVVLHDRTGGSDDNILGWYPTELTPAGDLGLFAGEDLSGDWTLFVSDNAGADTGTLNEWCLNIEYGGVQPVMLSNSSVVADADGVHLSWELSLTEENIYFNILRSPAGENNFSELDITPEVSTPLSYLASDTSAEPGVSYNYQVNFSLDDNSSVLFTSEAIMVPTMPNALHRNVPNPFNPSTKITYDLSQPSMVKLTIYDIAGRVVCNLVNEHVGAGRHDVIWAGKNNKGEPVTSGVYFYLVEAGGFRQSKRMMLVK
jgi:subtilisin-like proprotein convertase family protein